MIILNLMRILIKIKNNYTQCDMMKYDYLIVGSGLFGSVFAYEMNKLGKNILVIEKRDHIGGNLYTENVDGINVHKYGAHIMHIGDKEIWDYINQFAEFNNYVHNVIARYKDEVYNLPFNMNTFHQIWGVKTPEEAKNIIKKQKNEQNIKTPTNLEEQAINLVGIDIYNKLIKGYTEKQWGRKCSELPSFIIRRIPTRYIFDNNYFDIDYQGIPIGGYTKIIEKMLKGIDVKLNTDFFENKEKWDEIADKILFTGMIDQYYDYCFEELEYRSLKFVQETKNIDNFQGATVVNYTDINPPYTRIIEHKHFESVKTQKTIITYEYPQKWERGIEAYYPINDEKNTKLFKKYRNLADKEKNIIFGGRLGNYKYYDMENTIKSSLELVKQESNHDE